MTNRGTDGKESSTSFDENCLGQLLKGKLIRKDDPEYDQKKRLYFNAMLYSFKPKCFVEVEDIKDIVTVIREVAGKVSKH